MKAAASNFCIHCGTPVPAGAGDARFCCTGCACVHELLCSEGLQKFYDLRGMQALAPVSPQALRDRDYGWLGDLAGKAEGQAQNHGNAHLDLAVQGVSCVGCVWLIEKVFQQSQGAGRIEINATRGQLGLEWLPGFQVVDFARQLQRFGYLLGPCEPGAPRESALAPVAKRLGLCGAFAMNAMAFTLPSYLGMSPDFLFASWFDVVAACSATLALAVGGSYFAQRSWNALRRGVLHIDTPIALGIGAAWTGSVVGWVGGIPGLKYFDFVAVFIFLMLAGRWMQMAAVERNRRRLLQCASVPDTISRRGPDGVVGLVPLQDISTGDVLLLNPGQVCPVASQLEDHAASLSLEWINGESAASPRTAGQLVPSGALNIGVGSIAVRAQEAWSESLLQRLLKTGSETQEFSPFLGRLLRVYLASVVLLGLAGAAVWWGSGAGAARALQVMISVFVVSCPCALGVAAPLADDLAASWMQRLGVFVRSNFLWQRLARVRKIIFDKTGTLTLENPALKNPESIAALTLDQKRALRLLVSSNLHPVSRSLFDAVGAVEASAAAASPAKVEEVVGQGLSFVDAEGRRWSLGRASWLDPAAEQEMADAVFSCDGHILARFKFEDALRPETVESLERLGQEHFDLHLLSGDRTEKVRQIAETLRLPRRQWHAELSPEQKAAWVNLLNDEDTLYLGDGANDSLALEAALCSGSPVTGRNFLEHKADFYFLGSSLRFVAELLDVAKRRRRAVRSVFAFALCYNVCAVVLSLAGLMSPLLAAVLMPLSSVVTLAIVRVMFGRSGRRGSSGWQGMKSQNETGSAQNMRSSPQAALVA